MLLTLRNLSSDSVVALGLHDHFLSFSPSFLVLSEVEENCTDSHLHSLCNFSVGKTSILKCLPLLVAFFLAILVATHYFPAAQCSPDAHEGLEPQCVPTLFLCRQRGLEVIKKSWKADSTFIAAEQHDFFNLWLFSTCLCTISSYSL